MLDRRAYIRDILDEDKKIYKQVFDREKEQIRTMDEEILPKKPADIGVEIKTESLVGQLRNLLENILSKIELFIGRNWDGAPSMSYPTLPVDYGKILNFWNEIVRRLVRPDIKTDFRTKQAIKEKITEIEPQINSLYFTLREFISAIANKITNRVNFEASRKILKKRGSSEPTVLSDTQIFQRFFGPLSKDPKESGPTAIKGGALGEFPAMVIQVSTIYSIISLIKKQIDKQNYSPINNADIGNEMRSFSQSLGPADESQFVERDDDLFRFNVFLNHYINSNAGIKYGDQKLENAVGKAIMALESELGRKATQSEIISIRQRYGQRGDAPLFFVPEIGGLSDGIYDENVDLRGQRQRQTTARDAIEPTERNQIDSNESGRSEFPEIDLNPNITGNTQQITEQSESYKRAIIDRLESFMDNYNLNMSNPARQSILDLGYIWSLTNEMDDALKEVGESTRQTDADFNLIDRLKDALEQIPATDEANIRRRSVNLNQLIDAFIRLFIKYVDNVLVPQLNAGTEERVEEALGAIRDSEGPRMIFSSLGRPQEPEPERPIISETEPVLTPETMTEGSGRVKRRKPARFSYKLGKVLGYDDTRNELYN